MRLICALAVMLVAGSAFAQPTPVPVRFPESTVPVVPVPVPDNAVAKLTVDTLYVIECDVPCLVLASPIGRVTVTEDAGPIKIRGRFIDGVKTETRTYSGKQVVTIEALSSGRVEILVVPVGASTPADVLRRTIDVDAGEGPRPPPVDPPEPPAPPVPQPVVGARVLLVYESTDPMSRETLNTIHSTKLRELLSAKCLKDPDGRPAWRVWDKDVDASNESQTWRDALAAARPTLTKLPSLVIFSGKDGKAYPLPETEAATLEFLSKTLGGS